MVPQDGSVIAAGRSGHLGRDENRWALGLRGDWHDHRATIVTCQPPVKHWREALGEPTLADANRERLGCTAYKIALHAAARRKPPAKLTRSAAVD
jgi:hypothetical protein